MKTLLKETIETMDFFAIMKDLGFEHRITNRPSNPIYGFSKWIDSKTNQQVGFTNDSLKKPLFVKQIFFYPESQKVWYYVSKSDKLLRSLKIEGEDKIKEFLTLLKDK